MNEEIIKYNRRLYEEFVDKAYKAIQKEYECMAKWIATGSIVGFGYSLHFSKPDYFYLHPSFYFLLSILFLFSSYSYFIRSMRKRVEYARKYYIEENDKYENKRSFSSRMGSFYNILACFFCFIGFLVLSLGQIIVNWN